MIFASGLFTIVFGLSWFIYTVAVWRNTPGAEPEAWWFLFIIFTISGGVFTSYTNFFNCL